MIEVRRLTRDDIKTHLPALAHLRIEIFREFPYIYNGSLDYEVKYLKKYLESDKAALMAAFDGKKVVGVASCLPLKDEPQQVYKDFVKNNFEINKIFYFGESVLQKNYRGQGLGKIFFAEREKWARSFKNKDGAAEFQITTFCAVDRPVDHPLKPDQYVPLYEFWKKQGYVKQSEMKAEMAWQDVDQTAETTKQLTFWLKKWET